jgi:heat shock protein HslJ
MNDGTVTTAADPSRYLIQFNTDGTLDIKADCNNVGGMYTTDGNQLTISLGPSTLIACPPDSQADAFTQGLSKIGSYLFDGDNLVLEIKLDSGTMTFSPSAPISLVGAWDVTNVNNGNQAVVSLATGTAITMNFAADGTVSGNAGCNTFTGTYETSGTTLTVGPLASTRMACAEPAGVMEQETQFLTALQNAATYELSNNTLTIRDAGGATQVVAALAAPAALAGTNWDVTSVNNGKEAVVSLILDTKITLSFGTDDRVSGNAGCNTYNGPYTSTDTTLTVGPLINTLMACLEPSGLMEQETQYLAALQKAATYEIQGTKLTIRDAGGAMQVVATAAP